MLKLILLSSQLDSNGFTLSTSPYVKIRGVYVNTGSAVASFNVISTKAAIQSSWLGYLSTLNTTVLNLNIWIIDQNLYYDLKLNFEFSKLLLMI